MGDQETKTHSSGSDLQVSPVDKTKSVNGHSPHEEDIQNGLEDTPPQMNGDISDKNSVDDSHAKEVKSSVDKEAKVENKSMENGDIEVTVESSDNRNENSDLCELSSSSSKTNEKGAVEDVQNDSGAKESVVASDNLEKPCDDSELDSKSDRVECEDANNCSENKDGDGKVKESGGDGEDRITTDAIDENEKETAQESDAPKGEEANSQEPSEADAKVDKPLAEKSKKAKSKKNEPRIDLPKRITRSSSGVSKAVKYTDFDDRILSEDDEEEDDIRITKEVKKKDDESDIEMIEESDPLAISDADVKKAKEASKEHKKDTNIIIIDTNTLLKQQGSITPLHTVSKGMKVPSVTSSVQTTTPTINNSASQIQNAIQVITGGNPAIQGLQSAYLSAIQQVLLTQSGGQMSNPNYLAQLQQYYNTLGALQDDAYVIEAPSFIVPYVMEGKPVEAIKDYLSRINKELEEEERRAKEEEEIKLRKKDKGDEEKMELDEVEEEKKEERQEETKTNKEESEDKTTKEEKENKTADEETEDKLSKEETEKKPSKEETEEKPSKEETEEKPSKEETEDKPSKEESEDKPSKEESEDKPSKEDSEDKLSKEDSEDKLSKEDSEDKPSKENSENETIIEESEGKISKDESHVETSKAEDKSSKGSTSEDDEEKVSNETTGVKTSKAEEDTEKLDEKDKEEIKEKDKADDALNVKADNESPDKTKEPDNVTKETVDMKIDDKTKESADKIVESTNNKENKVEEEEIIDLDKEEEAKKDDLSHLGRWECYYKSALGNFFLDLGLTHTQQFIQADLLKMRKRKLEKMKTHPSRQDVIAVKILESQLENTKAKNSHLHVPVSTCKFCSYKTESKLVMERHLESPHMINYTYKCNFCDFETRGPQVILFHTEAEHNVRGRLERAPAFFQCPLCPYEDNNKSKMTRHSFSCSKKFKADKNCDLNDWEPPAKIPKIQRGRPNTFNKSFESLKMPNILPKTLGGLGLNIQNAINSGLLTSGSVTNFNSMAGRGRGRPVGSYKNISQPITGRSPGSMIYQNRSPGLIQQISGVPSAQQLSIANQVLQSVTQGANRVQRILPAATANSLIPGLAASSSITIQSVQNKTGNTKSPQQPSISITPLPRGGSGGKGVTSSSSQRPSFVICEICDGYIKDLEQLRNHMNLIHKVKIHPKMIYNRPPLNCQKCQHRFFTDQGLERHLLGTHGLVTSSMQEAANKGKDAGRCPICGKVFQWKLLNHVSRDHKMTLKPAHLSYKCTVCTATFNMYRLFENHVYSAHSVVNKNKNSEISSNNSNVTKKVGTTSSEAPLKINDEITIIPQPAGRGKCDSKSPPKKSDPPSMSKEITITKVGSRSTRRSGSGAGGGGVEVISLDDSPQKRELEEYPKKKSRETKRARGST